MEVFKPLLEKLSPVQKARYVVLLDLVQTQLDLGQLPTDYGFTKFEQYAKEMAELIEG